MGPKLRKRKSIVKETNISSPDSSKSSDSEHQKAMNIITRLSQKYLRTRSSTTSSKKDQKTPYSSESEYDGDAEYTSDDSPKTDEAMCIDTYDFNESDSEITSKVQSPMKGSHKSRSRTRRQKKTSSNEKDKENLSKRPKKGINTSVVSTPVLREQTKTKVDKQKSEVHTSTKVKKTIQEISPIPNITKESVKPVPPVQGIKRKADKAGLLEELSPILAGSRSFQNPAPNDSGVFVSPQPRMKMSRGVAKDTSTPSTYVLRPRAEPVVDKDLGFRTIEKPSSRSFISPVIKDESSTSDYVSMETVPPLTFDDTCMDEDRQSSSPSALFMENEDLVINKSTHSKSYKSSKKKYAKGRYSIGKLEEWANKMNTEFAEIESFELSIEG
ncbi:hypothetical protein ScPMuIL_014022 [Solemya velum]